MALTQSSFRRVCFVRAPHGLRKLFQGCGDFPSVVQTTTHTCQYTCIYAHSHTFIQKTSDSQQFYCRMFTGESLVLVPCLRDFKAEPCNYQPITPVWLNCSHPFIRAVFPHQALFMCGLGALCVVWDHCLLWQFSSFSQLLNISVCCAVKPIIGF